MFLRFEAFRRWIRVETGRLQPPEQAKDSVPVHIGTPMRTGASQARRSQYRLGGGKYQMNPTVQTEEITE